MNRVCVVGAGLAGCELSYQLAKNNISVTIFDPKLNENYKHEVYKTNKLAELVCSNSFRSNNLHNAAGLLKEELRKCDSLIISMADKHRLPAGGALAVSRDEFSIDITNTILTNKNINVVDREVNNLNELINDFDALVVASGPLTSSSLSNSINELIGEDYLYFYDAIAPLIDPDSINMDICFKASRYEKDTEGDYINIPLNKDQYESFVEELLHGKKVAVNEGDNGLFFQGCMPVEVMADTGKESLLHGPMRGDGLYSPSDGKELYSAVQLRQDNVSDSIYNMVGFQTRLTYPEQDRIFRLLPGLEEVEFVRYGSMHRNTYINSPIALTENMNLKVNDKIYMAGQISGVEGYIESVAQGYYTSQCILKRFGVDYKRISRNTVIGSLANYIINSGNKNFQPMKSNFGIVPKLEKEDKKKYMEGKGKYEMKMAMARRSLDTL
jgi:methylenetetrahydrofolate--tRNA-(uracil-5-)-methyltransferase